MSQDASKAGGDTLEFLKIVGMSEPAQPPAAASGAQPPAGSPYSAPIDVYKAAPVQASSAPVSDVPAGTPVAMKGGPRGVARADGSSPTLGYAVGQKRVELPSGKKMFQPKKRKRPFLNVIAALVLLTLAGVAFFAAYTYSMHQITLDQQQRLIGTGSYDGALSLTPANDGGYYTVFFVTSTPTDEKSIGELSQVVMYRTDKARTKAVRVIVPTNLYVSPSKAYSHNYYSLSATLSNTQNITRTLQAICDALGVRLYNVVCCDEAEFAVLNGYMNGTADPAGITTESLMGKVRTNLSAEDLAKFFSDIRRIGMSNIKEITVPTTDLAAGEVLLLMASPNSYRDALNSVIDFRKYDEHGNFYGTQYDEYGNPILDENGNPVGAILVDGGMLYFDDDGYLVFYGQHYDENGYPVGMHYDEAGNPMYDDWGNPAGTVYDDWGNPMHDWLGNILIEGV